MSAPSLAASRTRHQLRTYPSGSGRERIELTARLDSASGLISRPIRWKLRPVNTEANLPGLAVHDSLEPLAIFHTAPGDYLVEAEYGYVKRRHYITVLAGNSSALTMVLDVGALRPLSTIPQIALPGSISVEHRIYRADDTKHRHAVAVTHRQGEMLRVAAGKYSIESRFSPGNTVAHANLSVRPGYLSGINIEHSAGLVAIELLDPLKPGASLAIADTRSNWRFRTRKKTISLVLAEGRYHVAAPTTKGKAAVSFSVRAGTKTIVQLGAP